MPYFNSIKDKCKYLEEQNLVLMDEIKKLKEKTEIHPDLVKIKEMLNAGEPTLEMEEIN